MEDPVAGRFVADQVAALSQRGARVRVASFDPAGLVGAGPFRERLAREVDAALQGSHELAAFAFTERGSASGPGIPVARLPIANGRTPRDPVLHAAQHRAEALRWLAEQVLPVGADHDGSFRPSVVHAHTGYPDGVAAAVLADALNVPLIITEHATFLDRQLAIPSVRAAYVRAASRASRLLAVSGTFAAEIRAALPEIADCVGVMPNAVDVHAFRLPDPGERRAGELLFVGYLKEIKGIDVLLEALAAARRQRPDTTLRLVGDAADPALDQRWRALAERLGISNAVSFDPPMNRAGVADAMRRADIFVHASRRETFGVVAAEALAAGLPVVAADSGGVTEMIGDPSLGLGLVVPRDDPEAFARAIITVLDHRKDYDGARLRASAVDRFDADAVAVRLLDLYANVSAEWAARRPTHASPPPSRQSARGAAIGRVSDSLVVVAFDPERAQMLARLPERARARITLVTSKPSKPVDRAGFRQVVLTDVHERVRLLADANAIGPRATGWRRLVRAGRHPLATARRLGILPGLNQAILGHGGAAIADAIRSASIGAATPPILVCADGVDHLAAKFAINDGTARPAPGGLRWLTDQLAEEDGSSPALSDGETFPG